MSVRPDEARVQQIGRELFERVAADRQAFYSADRWTAALFAWSLAHEDSKLQLFRFVDVLPALDTNRDLVRHLREYFEGRDAPYAGLLHAALGVARVAGRVGDAVIGVMLRETVRRLARSRGTELDYLRTDMRDLSALGNGEFDIVFHQHSLVFVPDAARVIAEVARVLAPRGVYVFSTMHPVTFLFYESWTGTGWRPKKTYFNDRPVPVLDPTWDFGRVKVRAPTYEYAHRTADLVNWCVEAGLSVDGLWEWSPHQGGGPAGSDDALEQKLPAFIQIRAKKASSSSNRGATGSRPRTDPPAPPPFARPPGYSRPSPRRTRAR